MSTREAILAGAGEVLARRGVDAASIGELATAAGVTRPTVYAHFPGGKADVVAALVARVRDDVLAAQEVRDTDDPRSIARRAVTDYLDLTVRHRRVLEILAQLARADPAYSSVQDEILDRVHRRNARFLARLAATGRAAPVLAPEHVSEAITGIVRRFAERIDADPSARDDLVEAAVAAYLALGGLGASP
ncbi:TetR/AcrR family transcriptional regulator [Actinomycetospora termitidis]|uniref:TetR family transcriptional regulator n=1 Tax=Actinomycetospora termitidis TaxID=3053470 RepID=A0ABT7MDV0_9PSEU|nr:TetR family transcriptional regulator [Actinomycetospora sp. Odt1-22]MDL5158840.1 TetR family transcriptional regulator [Actinomycetospora sp. Odt1-22]